MQDILPIWVIYENPVDLPDRFVARKWLLDRPTGELHQARTLEDLRNKLPRGLVKLNRDPSDDPKIVECWI